LSSHQQPPPPTLMHLFLSILTERCPHALDIWVTYMPCYFILSKRVAGRNKANLLQQLGRIIDRYTPPKSVVNVLYNIVCSNRHKMYSRLHQGRCIDPHRHVLNMACCSVGHEVEHPKNAFQRGVYVFETCMYRSWRNNCLFRGMRPDFARVVPGFEQECQDSITSIDSVKRVWTHRVDRIRTCRERRRAHKLHDRVENRVEEIQRLWQEAGGHVHRMPSSKWDRQRMIDAVHSGDLSVIAFFVFLMQNKNYRFRTAVWGTDMCDMRCIWPTESARSKAFVFRTHVQ